MLRFTGPAEVVMHRIEQRHFGPAIGQRELFVMALFRPGS